MVRRAEIRDKKEQEIYSLLDLSKAINGNTSPEDLFKTYGRLMEATMKIDRLALFVRETGWNCEVNFGTEDSLLDMFISRKILEIKEECQILEGFISKEYDPFSLVLPIVHNLEIHAYLLLGGFEDNEELPLYLDLPFVRTFTNILVVAIENKRLAERELERIQMEKEMEIARVVQENLIPSKFPESEGLKIQAKYLPHTQVGGDYYDFVEAKDGIYICLADVSGKGVPAALFMSNVQATFRVLVGRGLELDEIIQELNKILVHNGKGSLFVSLVIAYYNHNKKYLSYINAGHLPGLCTINGNFHLLDKGTTVLGEFEELPFLEKSEIRADEIALCFFSDGLTEARNEEGEEYGLDRLISTYKKESTKDPETQINKLLASLNSFKGEVPLNDDLTLISCKIKS